ncbi:MAG: LacI family transcriptional regulator [Treponema sp.]|jgi:LacI family transcriptional regulator|nr:LacI family transcriptional regulator [Treponema sp.]
MGVTIKDIAKKTGLSITTISLVLNKKENRIPEKTRQIIESAALELNYTPNQAAVSLSTKKTNTIGLIIPDGSSYYFADLLASVERACRNTGYSLCVSFPEGDAEASFKAIQDMLRHGTDGIIVDPSVFGSSFQEAYIDLVVNTETPISSLAGTGAHLLSNSVIPNHRQGGYLAAAHLLGLGHTRIGAITGPGENYAVSDFLIGVEEAMEEFHLDFEAMPRVSDSNSAAAGYENFDTVLAGGLTGLITGFDTIARGVYRRAHERQIRIPDDLSVTGYGNCAHSAEFYVPLTTVSLHYDRIARKAVHLIKKLNEKKTALTPELIPPSLIVRESTAKPGS